MRLGWLTRFLAPCILLCGCRTLVSIQPLAPADKAVFDADLVGAWTDSDETVYVVRQSPPNQYAIESLTLKSNEKTRFRGQLFEVGGERVLDIAPTDNPALTISAHAFVRLRKAPEGLEVRMIGSDWLIDNLKRGTLAHFLDGDDPVITAPTEQVLGFIQAYGLKEDGMGETSVLKRLTK